MGEIILHVGMNKTGSSSIQENLARRAPDARFRYANLGEPNHSVDFLAAFASEEVAASHFSGSRADAAAFIQKRRAESLRLFERELAMDSSELLLFSAESVTTFTESDLACMRDVLTAGGRHRVRVVAYVRPPCSFMTSAFQQLVKRRRSRFELLPPHYRFRFEKLDAVFGAPSVELWLYEPRAFQDGCVVRDFCSRIGVDPGSTPAVRFNDGLSRRAVGLLFALRKHRAQLGVPSDPHATRTNQALVERLASLEGPRLSFARAVLDPVLEAERDDIAWMEARLGRPFPKEDVGPEGEAVSSEEDLLTFDDVAIQWLVDELHRADPDGPRLDPATVRADEVPALVHRLDPGAVRADEVPALVHRLGEALIAETTTVRQDAATLMLSTLEHGTPLPSRMSAREMGDVLGREIVALRQQRIVRAATAIERPILERLRRTAAGLPGPNAEGAAQD